jgi:hypothetical protein
MGNANQSCSVCSLADANILDAINKAIREKKKFRDLAAQTGISKSTLQRHAAKCLPLEILARHKSAGFDPLYRFRTLWPGQELTELPNDSVCVFAVQYAPQCVASYGDLRNAPYSQENFSQWLALAVAEVAERAALEKESLLPAEPAADVNPV